MATIQPTRPGVALTLLNPTPGSARSRQTSGSLSRQSSTESRPPSQNHAARMETVVDSLGNADPSRADMRDLSHDFAVLKRRSFEVIDSLVALYTVNPSGVRKATGMLMNFEQTLDGLSSALRDALESEVSVWWVEGTGYCCHSC